MLLVEDPKNAEAVILKLYLKMEFQDACKILSKVKTSKSQKLENRLGCFNPFMDENGLIKVGSRLRQSFLEFGAVHPVLLSQTGNVITMIIRWCHERATHSERHIIFNELWTYKKADYRKNIHSVIVGWTCLVYST